MLKAVCPDSVATVNVFLTHDFNSAVGSFLSGFILGCDAVFARVSSSTLRDDDDRGVLGSLQLYEGNRSHTSNETAALLRSLTLLIH